MLASCCLLPPLRSAGQDDAAQRLPAGVSRSEYKVRSADGRNFTGARIEPPFWWTGMADPVVEVLIYDKGIGPGRPSLSYPGVQLRSVHRVANPNYLFLELEITASARPGVLEIRVDSEGRQRSYPYTLLERPAAGTGMQGLRTDDVIYLLMPDRFANGDPANDVAPGMQQREVDRGKMYFRHGGDLRGLEQRLDYLQDLGITAIWCTPVQENDQPYESYHGYAITDHYRIDPRLGTNEDYLRLVLACHRRGMKVVMDVIHNHVGDQHWFIRDLPDPDWIHQHDSFWQTNYRDQVFMDPYTSDYDRRQMAQGWFDRHMPDLNQRHPRLARYLVQNHLWWIAYSGIDAFRIDTYIYPDQDFMAAWARAIRAAYPAFGLFAETWVHGSPNQAWFTQHTRMRRADDNAMPAVTDFQLYYAICEALTREQGWTEGLSRLYLTLGHDFLYEDPSRNVTFLDNHDLSRFYSIVGEDTRKLETGLTWLFTVRGIPMIYYGTEIGMKNFSDPDGKVREDFPGGWPGDAADKFTRAGRTAEENRIYDHVQKLIRLRKTIPALSSGRTRHFIPFDGTYVYFRYDDRDTVMVAVNVRDRDMELDLARFAEMLPAGRSCTDLLTGKALPGQRRISIPAATALVLRWH